MALLRGKLLAGALFAGALFGVVQQTAQWDTHQGAAARFTPWHEDAEAKYDAIWSHGIPKVGVPEADARCAVSSISSISSIASVSAESSVEVNGSYVHSQAVIAHPASFGGAATRSKIIKGVSRICCDKAEAETNALFEHVYTSTQISCVSARGIKNPSEEELLIVALRAARASRHGRRFV